MAKVNVKVEFDEDMLEDLIVEVQRRLEKACRPTITIDKATIASIQAKRPAPDLARGPGVKTAPATEQGSYGTREQYGDKPKYTIQKVHERYYLFRDADDEKVGYLDLEDPRKGWWDDYPEEYDGAWAEALERHQRGESS